MTKLNELIEELCPNGVEYKSMGELGDFYGGLSGKSKDDFRDGNEKFITYRNVYSNPALDLDIEDRVKISENEKQNTLQYGDIIFTGSSETPDECGFSSVITKETNEKLYLNSFCFFFRFRDLKCMLPDFAKHLFRSENLREQIGKTASGVTRYNVSKDKMKKVVIPLPPLAAQCEIVRILDGFTLLTAELTAELTARRKQYEYYRDRLCSNGGNLVRLGDIAIVQRGGNFQKKDFRENGVPCIHYGQIYTRYGVYADSTFSYIDEDVAHKSKRAVQNDIIMAVTSENLEDVCKCVAWLGEEEIAVSGHTAIIHHNQNPKWLSYYFHSTMFFEQKKKIAHGTKVIEVTPDALNNITIPVPSLEVQEKIVETLDKFDKLCNDLSEGLPAEIEKRQKQYEYYRDKLLTLEPVYRKETPCSVQIH